MAINKLTGLKKNYEKYFHAEGKGDDMACTDNNKLKQKPFICFPFFLMIKIRYLVVSKLIILWKTPNKTKKSVHA